MEREQVIVNRINECIEKGEITNQGMKQIIENVSVYLGLKTLTQKSKDLKISYQAARKHIYNTVNISGKEFIIDNE